MYTKGEWAAEEIAPDEWAVMQSLTMVCYHAQAKERAELIAAAVNGCQSVNPDNPLAVAESIKDLHEALKQIAEGKGRYSHSSLTHADHIIDGMKELAQQALAKAEGREA